MKKTISVLSALFMVMSFIYFSCNSPTDPGGEEEGEAEDVTISSSNLAEYYAIDSSTHGAQIDLSEYNLLDISKYASVVVNVTLCSDPAGSTPLSDTPAYSNEIYVQFKLLKADGGWDDADNIIATQNNLVQSGNTTHAVGNGETGVPKYLLLVASADSGVNSIIVNSIAFKASGDVTFSIVFGETFVEVDGNKITFIGDTKNDNHAVLCTFPASWRPLTGKTITISYTLEDGYDAEKWHQLIIQAANGLNDVNYNSYQQYKDLNDAEAIDAPASGTITIEGDMLEDGAANGPFTLTGMRIVNNGGTSWNSKDREKAYTVTFNSITIN